MGHNSTGHPKSLAEFLLYPLGSVIFAPHTAMGAASVVLSVN